MAKSDGSLFKGQFTVSISNSATKKIFGHYEDYYGLRQTRNVSLKLQVATRRGCYVQLAEIS
jgi:hypothetical protein